MAEKNITTKKQEIKIGGKDGDKEYKIKNVEIDPEIIKLSPGRAEEFDKEYSTLKITGNPGKDIFNFYTSFVASKDFGFSPPYKSLREYYFDTDKKTGIEFIKTGVQLDYFFKLYPNYPSDNILNDLKSDPNLLLFEKDEKTYVTISGKTIDNFIYRGEDVAAGLAREGDILKIFDNYINKNQRAIGRGGGVSTAINPIASTTQFLSSDGGFWVIDKKALKDLKNDGAVTNIGETLIGFQEHIPFKYVKNFITSNPIRNQLLAKYGAANTQIFDGRQLRDVITGLNINPENYKNETLKKVFELNSAESRPVIAQTPGIAAIPNISTEKQKFKAPRAEVPVTTYPGQKSESYREELPENITQNVSPSPTGPTQLNQPETVAGEPKEFGENSPGYIPNWEKELEGESEKKDENLPEKEDASDENGEVNNEEDSDEGDPGDVNFPTEEETDSQIEEAGAKEKVSPMDLDFLLILIFAVLVDAADIILEITGILIIPKLIGIVIDLVVFAIISLWMAWRSGRIANAKKEQQQKVQKMLEQQMQKMQKLQKAGNMSQKSFDRYMRQYGQKMGKSTQTAMRLARSTFGKRLLRMGLVLLAEIVPILGIIPWWVITVVPTLREK